MSARSFLDSVRIEADAAACEDCGSTSRIGRGLCLNCLLHRCLATDNENTGTLEQVLDEIDIRDADWRIGNYQILEEIGRGGMGVIYRARQRHSRRIVALKRILSYQADSQETLARFRREAEAAASLDHPNILPIYEVSETEDGLPFFSMKFAPGGSLLDAVEALRNEPRRSVALMAKVARAVQFAHLQGILHRDLKPGNIMLDARGEPLVSDFGLAKWLDTSADLTRTLTIFGTPGYIAPEQVNRSAANLTPAADIYSLGAILFELFSGHPPFLGEHALAVIQQASEQSAPKLRSVIPGFNRDLETICAKCLEREPHARYRSAGELAEDLERWLEGKPIVARPVLPPVRIWRWSKRNPKLAASIAGCLLLLIIIGTIQVQNRIATREEAAAMHSVAVEPLLDLNTAQPDSKLTSEIAKALQSELSKHGPARVTTVPSQSIANGTFGNEDAKARWQRARTALQGTRHVKDGRLRLSLRLVNTADGKVVYRKIAEVTADGTASLALMLDAPNVYSILNRADLSSIELQETDPGLQDPKAREFIVAGRELMLRENVEDIDRSIKCLERAAMIQPSSSIAHAYLATVECSRTHYLSDQKYLQRAEKEARVAVQLSPQSCDAHRALAGVSYAKSQFKEAIDEQFQAIETGGVEEHVASFLGLTFKALGAPNQALPWLELARKWEARPGDYDSQIADCWVLLNEDDKAEVAYIRATDLHPEMPQGWVGLARLRIFQGKNSDARRIWQENRDRHQQFVYAQEMAAQIHFFTRNYLEAERSYTTLVRNDPDGGSEFYGAVSYSSALGRLRQLVGDDVQGNKILNECLAKQLSILESSPRNAALCYQVAAIYSSLGEKTPAIRYLREATSAGWLDFRSLAIDPRFDALADDPDFRSIVRDLATKVAGMRQETTGQRPVPSK